MAQSKTELYANQLSFISKGGVSLKKYYELRINRTEFLGEVVEIIHDLSAKHTLPDQYLEVAPMLDWLAGMPKTGADGLHWKSSGSFWTAWWDVDVFYENEPESEELDNFIKNLEFVRRILTPQIK